MKRLSIEAENPVDYFDALQEEEYFYTDLSEEVEKAMSYALKPLKLIPSEIDLQAQLQICHRIAIYYERLHNIQHEYEQHTDEVFG